MQPVASAHHRLAVLRSHVAGPCSESFRTGAGRPIERSACASFDVAAHQASIPRVPLPSLDATMARYLDRVRPLATPAEFARTKKAVAKFLENEGPLLQADLRERDRHAQEESYIKAFWDEMYLGGRYPIPINSNPACSLHPDPKRRGDQAGRTASLVCAASQWYQAYRRNEIQPDGWGSGKPRCMREYELLFATARIPMLGKDILRTFPESRHVALFRGESVYVMDVLTASGDVVPESELERHLRALLAVAESTPPRVGASAGDAPLHIGDFTAGDRDVWAGHRARLAQAAPVNGRNLAAIDSALMVVCLDQAVRSDLSDGLNIALHGHSSAPGRPPSHRWFDKSVILATDPDGNAYFTFEHSPFDGSTIVRMMSDVWAVAQGRSLRKLYGHADLTPTFAPAASAAVDPPRRLEWHLPDDLRANLRGASVGLRNLVASNSTRSVLFEDFGKREMKTWGVSPDGALQAAFQVTYYRLHRPRPAVSVYESCSTKAWRGGRTEAIRSVTPESVSLARALSEHALGGDGGGPRDQRIALLLRASAARHREVALEAAACAGVDRHLFSLAGVAQASRAAGAAMPGLFTDPLWVRLNTSVLSTSNVNSPAMEALTFGAVCPQGYGIGYVVKDDHLWFTVSHFVRDPDTGGSGFGGVALEVSSTAPGDEQGGTATATVPSPTDGERFAAELRRTLLAMRDIFRALR